jgi:hypothetical protein
MLIRKGLEKWKSEGVVGIKMDSLPFSTPKQNKAVDAFEKIMRNEKKKLPQLNPFYIYIIEEMLDMATDLDCVRDRFPF